MIKLRKPRDRSASAMLIEPPYTLRLPDSDDPEDGASFRWRYLKYDFFVRRKISAESLFSDKPAAKT